MTQPFPVKILGHPMRSTIADREPSGLGSADLDESASHSNMSRRLILMRHAKQSGLAVRDHDRPLTDEGRDAAHRVGERLSEAGLIPERVLSSTALRCRETWQAIGAGLGTGRGEALEVDFESGLYNASSHDLLRAIAGVDDENEILLLLAHNPGISMLALELAAADEAALGRLRAGFSPATTACFEIEGPWSTLSARTARLIRFEAPGRA